MKSVKKKKKPHLAFPLYICKTQMISFSKTNKKIISNFLTPLFNDTATKTRPKIEKGIPKRKKN